jgi:hypothetical protein
VGRRWNSGGDGGVGVWGREGIQLECSNVDDRWICVFVYIRPKTRLASLDWTLRPRSGQAAEAAIPTWFTQTTNFPVATALQHQLHYAFQVVGLGKQIDQMDLLYAVACDLQRNQVAG